MSFENHDDEQIVEIFIPYGVCLHSVSVTYCCNQDPLVRTVNNTCGRRTDTAKAFRVYVFPPHRNNGTDQTDEPGSVVIPANGPTEVISRRDDCKTEPVDVEIPGDGTTDESVNDKMGGNGHTVSFGLL